MSRDQTGAKVDEVVHVELERPDGSIVYAQVEKAFPLAGEAAQDVLSLQPAEGGSASRLALDSDEVQKLRQRYPDLDKLLSAEEPAPATPAAPAAPQQEPPPPPSGWQAPPPPTPGQ